MTKTIWTGTFGAIVGAATIAALAQAPAPQQSTSSAPQPSASSASSDHKITVTGCLKPAPPEATDAAGATGTAGTSGAAGAARADAASDSSDAKFILADASISPAAAEPGAAGSSAGAAATPPSASADASQPTRTYRLLANPAALVPHVGKKLELTGTLMDDSGSASSGAAGQADASSKSPLLKVEAGKVLSTPCQQ